ncbi:MnhB domain-containing protein [Halorarius litoreus]|uniref:MnhB domain-containing protein n=1 Tax=Halorarius litoreus TaxID=2962676 RepID=UPI0020CD4E33|nr:MnhB domain-containing protein [Halorarius litoreus]
MTQERETTVIAKTVTRTVVPLIIVVAIALLFQGHNLPGGGFIAGVLTCTAVALTYIIYGIEFIQRDLLGVDGAGPGVLAGLPRWYARLFAVGLALAVVSGIVAMLLGYPFLTQAVVFLKGVPVYEEFEVASAFAFDLGVYFVVVGGLMTIVAVVGRE